MVKLSWCELPFSDVNWDNFAPFRVRVFFWVHRHANTHICNFLFRHGGIGVEDCPFCPGTAEDEFHHFFSCAWLYSF
jgi:hypothetical protein